MPYREEEGALRARRLSLETEIESLDHRAREVPYLEVRKRELQSELATLHDPDAKPTFSQRNLRSLMWAAGAATLVVGGAAAFIVHRNRANAPSTVSHCDFGPAQLALVPSAPVIPPNEPFQPTTFEPAAVEPAAVEPLATKPSGISIDFVGSGTSLSSKEVAGIAPLGHWNEVHDAVGSSRPLVDSQGTPIASMQVVWRSGDGWSDTQPHTGDRHMFSGFIEQNGAPNVQGKVVVSVTGLPPDLVGGKYAVVVYSDKLSNPEDQVTRLEMTAGDFHQAFYLRDAAFHDYPLRDGKRGYVVATGTRDDRMQTPVANCAIFKNVSATDLEIEVSTTSRTPNNVGGYLRSPINGLQIVPMTAL